MSNEPDGVEVAEVPPLSGTAVEALENIRSRMELIFDGAAQQVAVGKSGLIGWGREQLPVQFLPEDHAACTWYFVGDLHGDFLAWHTLLRRVQSDANFRLCFLGDLIDRGPHDIECFAAFLDAVASYPDQILWILGNHEDGISFDPASNRFVSSVIPSEFVDWLNAPTGNTTCEQARKWGALLIEICAGLPRAMLFPDGLLATHGGIPLEDRWPSLLNMESFCHPRTLGDFTWTRAASRIPSRKGWRYDSDRRKRSSAFDFGYRDLEGFCAAVEGVFPVKRLVRGHDHVEDGAEVVPGYEVVPVLTLNGFGFDYLTNSVAKYRSDLALGVWKLGELPSVERIAYAKEDYSLLYAEAGSGSSPDSE